MSQQIVPYQRSEYQLQALRVPSFYRKYCTEQAVNWYRCYYATGCKTKQCENQKQVLSTCLEKYTLQAKNNNLLEMYVNDPKKFESEHVADDLFTVQNRFRLMKNWSGYNLH